SASRCTAPSTSSATTTPTVSAGCAPPCGAGRSGMCVASSTGLRDRARDGAGVGAAGRSARAGGVGGITGAGRGSRGRRGPAHPGRRTPRERDGAGAPAPRPLGPDLRRAQRDMLLGVFTLADTTVDEVMTSRLDMVAVDIAATAEDVCETFRQSEHSRLPVYDGTRDNLVGIVFAKDLV